MGTSVKGYLAFTPMVYRILVFVVLPLAAIALRIRMLAANVFYYDDEYLIGSVLVGALYMSAEILADYMLFGGICSKSGGCPDAIAVSQGGRAILKNAFVVDLARRFVWVMVYAAACFAVTRSPKEFTGGLSICLLSVIALNVSRHLQIFQLHLIVAYVALMIFIFVRMMFLFLEEIRMVMIVDVVVYLILAVAASVLTVVHMMHCVKGAEK